MRTLSGIGVTGKIAIGTVYVLGEDAEPAVLDTAPLSPQQEAEKLDAALAESRKQLKAMLAGLDAEKGAIIATQLDFLDDPAFNTDARERILSGSTNAAGAIRDTTEELYQTFAGFDDDPYLQERAADIRDVGARILNNILGRRMEDLSALPPGTVLVAKDLAPSQTAQLNRERVAGFVTAMGGKTSHTAIMARSMGIAAVVGCAQALAHLQNGDTVIVDGETGRVLRRPDSATLSEYQALCETQACLQAEADRQKDCKLRRANGSPVLVAANIGTPQEAMAARENGADGIGLFRTEFLYMERDDFPGEDEQFEAYRTVAECFGEAPVILRTLDIGGDKRLPYLDRPAEENPFLGMRAIRLCMKHRELFSTQLRAILRAGVFGNLKIMFPMIGSLVQLQEAKSILTECKAQLESDDIPYRHAIEVGMMVEVPSAAVMADVFAKEVDFFSIGTNDLTQYTLAVDRGHPGLGALYDYMDPGVLRLIENTIKAARAEGIFCGMCGEMAADAAAIPLLAKYGLDEYSVAPHAVGRTKSLLMEQDGISGETH